MPPTALPAVLQLQALTAPAAAQRGAPPAARCAAAPLAARPHATLRSRCTPPPAAPLRSSCARRQPRRAALPTAASATPLLLPLTAREQIEQAAASASAALAAGAPGKRQRIELLLPVNQRAQSFTNTDALDYPSNVDTVHAAAIACAEALLRAVGGASAAAGAFTSRRVGDASDPCSVITTADRAFAVVVTPSAEHLPAIRKLAEDANRTALFILNPQWNEAGQIVSDFGIGPWKAAAMSFLDTFVPTYTLSEKRVGAASTLGPSGKPLGLGGVARLLRAYPGEWGVFAMGGDGSSDCVRTQAEEPTYNELKDVRARACACACIVLRVALPACSGGGTHARARWACTDARDAACGCLCWCWCAHPCYAFRAPPTAVHSRRVLAPGAPRGRRLPGGRPRRSSSSRGQRRRRRRQQRRRVAEEGLGACQRCRGERRGAQRRADGG
jgi:hypothetical protein